MCLLALDIGDKRIGVAITDAEEKISFPLTVIHRSNIQKDISIILDQAKEYQVRLIVAGLPRSLDGSLKVQADKTLHFIDMLKKKTTIPVDLWNEWLTTKEGESVLISADVRRNKRKQVIDKLAACLILDGYLRHMNQKQF